MGRYKAGSNYLQKYMLLWHLEYNLTYTSNHHGAEISVIWLIERSAIKLLILHITREK